MSSELLAVILTLLMLFLFFAGVPIAVAMFVPGFIGCCYVLSLPGALNLVSIIPFDTVSKYEWSMIPLFILMGMFVLRAGIGANLYNAAYKWLGHQPGGLASATVAASALFGSVCASAPATAATMGAVALPEMEKYGYKPTLSVGCITAGAVLGILIPPSMFFIIYGVIAEQSIGRLFIAGIIPGILVALLMIVTIYIQTKIDPTLGPRGPKTSFREKVMSLKEIWAAMVLFVFVIGGLFGGLFTPSEAGALGAGGALLLGLIRKTLTWKGVLLAMEETGLIVGMIFLVFVSAMVLSAFFGVSGIGVVLSDFLTSLTLPPLVILGIIILMYLILGCLMDFVPVILVTIPIVLPAVVALGFNPIWFGVELCLLSGLASITPPVGMMVYIMAGVAKVPLQVVFRGVLPYVATQTICVIIMLFFPQIVLFLPGIMMGKG